MRLDYWIIGTLLFSLIIVTGVFFIGDINANYGVNMSTEEFGSVYNTINETYEISQDMKEKTINADITTGEAWETMTKGSYSAIRLIGQTFGLTGSIINAIAIQIGIPAYFILFAMTALVVSIIFAIIYIFLRFGPPPR